MNISSQTLPQILLFAAGTIFGGLVAFFTWGMLSPDDPSSYFLPRFIPHQDKLLHFIAFGMMAVPAGIVMPRRYLGFILMSLVALAAGMEFAQDASGLGRESSWIDFAASSLGAITACLFLLFVRRFIAKRRENQTQQTLNPAE